MAYTADSAASSTQTQPAQAGQWRNRDRLNQISHHLHAMDREGLNLIITNQPPVPPVTVTVDRLREEFTSLGYTLGHRNQIFNASIQTRIHSLRFSNENLLTLLQLLQTDSDPSMGDIQINTQARDFIFFELSKLFKVSGMDSTWAAVLVSAENQPVEAIRRLLAIIQRRGGGIPAIDAGSI